MIIDDSSWKDVLTHYKNICETVLSRAGKLHLPGQVMEFEQLPPMTMRPELGAEITALMKNHLTEFYKKTGIPNRLRVTVVDLRDSAHLPLLLSGDS